MKKLMNLIVSLVLSVQLICSLAILKVSAEGADDELHIGVLQFVTHQALDEIYGGVLERLEDKGYVEGKNLTIDYQNAEGDMSLLPSLAEDIVAKDPDILIGIATPDAQAFMQAAPDKPIIGAAISDPVDANLVDSLEKPGGNVTAVSDGTGMDDQFDLYFEIVPDLKKIGILHTDSEDNARKQAELAKATAEERDLEVVLATIASTNDMQITAESLAGQVDAIYIPNDNTVASAFDTLMDVTEKAGIPVFSSVTTMVEQGSLASVAIEQAEMGRLAADIALEVHQGANPGEIAVRFVREFRPVYNSQSAKALGIDLPEALIADGEDLAKE